MSMPPVANQNSQDLAYLRPDDEIDLADLLKKIFGEWKLISVIAAFGLLASAFYAFSQKDVYEITAIISLPDQELLGDTTAQTLVPISPANALQSVIEEMTSSTVQKDSFLESSLKEQIIPEENQNEDSIFLEIGKSISIDRIKHDYYELQKDEKTPLADISISIDSIYRKEAEDFLNTLIKKSMASSLSHFEADVSKRKSEKLNELNNKLNSLSSAAKKSREAEIQRIEESNLVKIASIQLEIDQLLQKEANQRTSLITQYEEALAIAKQLDIKEPVTWEDLRPARNNSQITNELNENQRNSPLYFQGTRILEAEIKRLQSRKDDSAFISKLPDLKMKINLIENDPLLASLKARLDDTIYISDFENLTKEIALVENEPASFPTAQFANLTLNPVSSASPIEPNKKLILIAGLVLSLFLGLFIALLRIAMKGK